MIIYWLKNKINGKYYIGQTTYSIHDRFRTHCDDARRNAGCSVDRAIAKYGENKFEYFSIDSTATTQEELNSLEEFYINFFDATNRNLAYNLKSGGSHGKHAESTKQKLSRFRKNKTYTELMGEETAKRLIKNHIRLVSLRTYSWRFTCTNFRINNGKTSKFHPKDLPPPEGWCYGRAWHPINSRKGCKWVNNGITSYRIPPTALLPNGFRYGKLVRRTGVKT